MSVDCNIPTPCINPLVFLIKEVFGKVSDGVSVAVSLDTVLDSGISITSSSNFCCPDCNSKNGFYFLGSAYRFTDLIEVNGLGNTLPYGVPEATPFNKNLKYRCCVNYQLPMDIRGDYFSQFKPTEAQIAANVIYDKTPTCCSNDFVASVQELFMLTGADNTVLFGGLIEASTFGGKSGLGIILNFLKTISPAVSKLDLSAFLIQLLTRGIVVQCDGCDTTIMTVDQYQSYLTGFDNRA
jgi:hypothetical protein